MSTAAPSHPVVSTGFQRRMPPLAARYAMGAVMYGVLGPIVRVLERSGGAPRVLAALSSRRQRSAKPQNPLRAYTPTGHDVFVVAHVKSGTNWMMQIAHQLAFHGNAEYDHIHSVVAWPDVAMMGPMKNYAIPIEDPSVWMASPEQKRVIKTHFDWEWLPYSPEARYIIVIRDPKDVFVSSYHFFVKHGPLQFTRFSVATWLDLFLSAAGTGLWSSWPVNTAGYWAARRHPNVLVVPFKAMKQDLRGMVRKVAEFTGVHAGDEVIDRVHEKATFDYMKRIDEKFRAWEMIPWASTAAPMMRKGGQSASSELLSVEQQRRIDRYCIAELKQLGSDFPYEEFCTMTPGVSATATPA